MSNTKLLFFASELSKHDSYLECYSNFQNENYINIESPDGTFNYVCLDRETAIKLSKELKKQINNLIKDV